jgi:hypothetical protein
MALIVEDGAGRTDADSYASLTFADAYHVSMGNASWAAETEGARETALRRATVYADNAYTWRGLRSWPEQSLAWPRGGVVSDNIDIPSNEVPIQLQRAVCELALKALTADLMPDVSSDVVTAEAVGPVSVSYGNPRNGGLMRFSLVDSMLRDLLLSGGSGGSVRVVRA